MHSVHILTPQGGIKVGVVVTLPQFPLTTSGSEIDPGEHLTLWFLAQTKCLQVLRKSSELLSDLLYCLPLIVSIHLSWWIVRTPCTHSLVHTPLFGLLNITDLKPVGFKICPFCNVLIPLKNGHSRCLFCLGKSYIPSRISVYHSPQEHVSCETQG